MEHLDDRSFLDDFRLSREVLSEAGCCECRVYAFPNGSHRPGQAELLQAQGIEHVLAVGERPSRADARLHTRMTLRGDTASELRARSVNVTGAKG
jgi:hypothetical protein